MQWCAQLDGLTVDAHGNNWLESQLPSPNMKVGYFFQRSVDHAQVIQDPILDPDETLPGC